LPNTEIIIGSPPCVSFSSSNKSGNADKSLGVELTETFLRIVAVKKHQPNSILKAWFMENVVNSKRYLQTAYTFKDLGLSEWANKIE
jgi:DNA (cytosine-5)-methyltransferase 1